MAQQAQPAPAQPVLMTADQFIALGGLYERTQIENRQLARLAQAALSVDRCDGLVAENTRAWLRSMDGWATEGDVDDAFMISLAKHTTSGDLLEEIRQWCNAELSADTWADLREKVLQHFLSACENLKLQAQLEKTTQRNGETMSAYIRRFKAEAQRAYTGDRAESEEFRVVSSFLRGFSDRHFAERVFRKGQNTTLAEVTDAALEMEAQQEKLDQVLQAARPEAMEVDAVHAEAAGVTVSMLEKKIEQLSARLAKAEAQSKQKPQQRGSKTGVNTGPRQPQKQKADKAPADGNKRKKRSRPDHKWTEGGKPICNYCQKVGHLYRECKSRIRGDPAAAAGQEKQQQSE